MKVLAYVGDPLPLFTPAAAPQEQAWVTIDSPADVDAKIAAALVAAAADAASKLAAAVASGTYTPIASGSQTGVTVTPELFRWWRINSQLFVFGRIVVTTTTDAFTSVELTLPPFNLPSQALAATGIAVSTGQSGVDPSDVQPQMAVDLNVNKMLVTSTQFALGFANRPFQVSFSFSLA